MVAATRSRSRSSPHFFENRSAKPPISRRPAMLDHKNENRRRAPGRIHRLPLSKPSSRNTNFMWKLIAPMEPMEQKLPISSSQKGQLPQQVRETSADCTWQLRRGQRRRHPGFWPMSEGRSFNTNSTSGQVSNIMPPRRPARCGNRNVRSAASPGTNPSEPIKPDADVHDPHRLSAILVGTSARRSSGAGSVRREYSRPCKPPRTSNRRERAAHLAEAGERERTSAPSRQDQLARAEAVDQQRPDPDRQQRRERETQRDVRSRPAELALEIVVEKRRCCSTGRRRRGRSRNAAA